MFPKSLAFMESVAHYNFIIADDDKDDQDLLLKAFTNSSVKYESISVFNGRQLMDYLLCRKNYKNEIHALPDFIFLDINMPGKNGFEVLRELKANTSLQNIPVYIFSTTCSLNDQKIMLGLGAEKCYIKPYLINDYQVMIKEIISM